MKKVQLIMVMLFTLVTMFSCSEKIETSDNMKNSTNEEVLASEKEESTGIYKVEEGEVRYELSLHTKIIKEGSKEYIDSTYYFYETTSRFRELTTFHIRQRRYSWQINNLSLNNLISHLEKVKMLLNDDDIVDYQNNKEGIYFWDNYINISDYQLKGYSSITNLKDVIDFILDNIKDVKPSKVKYLNNSSESYTKKTDEEPIVEIREINYPSF